MSRKGMGNSPLAAAMTARQIRRAEAFGKGSRDVPTQAMLRMLTGNPSWTSMKKGGHHA